MREQLIKYVELLFAGSPNTDDMQQEILQNTLDRYDDLVSQGKNPEAAYRLAIAGIGDLGEILGESGAPLPDMPPIAHKQDDPPAKRIRPVWRKVLRALSIFLYIVSAIPLIVLSEFGYPIVGLCILLCIVGLATGIIILTSSGESHKKGPSADERLKKPVRDIINAVGLTLYLVIIFATSAWAVTWLIFPIMGAVKGIIVACMDLKEGK